MYRTQSSAKRMFEVMSLPMSLTYNKEKSGPRTVPWGIPDSTITCSHDLPSTTTFCFLPINDPTVDCTTDPVVLKLSHNL